MILTTPYMHDVGLNEYMMKVFPCLDEVTFTCYVDAWSVKVCGLMKSLLRMYGVMGFHMFIALID